MNSSLNIIIKKIELKKMSEDHLEFEIMYTSEHLMTINKSLEQKIQELTAQLADQTAQLEKEKAERIQFNYYLIDHNTKEELQGGKGKIKDKSLSKDEKQVQLYSQTNEYQQKYERLLEEKLRMKKLYEIQIDQLKRESQQVPLQIAQSQFELLLTIQKEASGQCQLSNREKLLLQEIQQLRSKESLLENKYAELENQMTKLLQVLQNDPVAVLKIDVLQFEELKKQNIELQQKVEEQKTQTQKDQEQLKLQEKLVEELMEIIRNKKDDKDVRDIQICQLEDELKGLKQLIYDSKEQICQVLGAIEIKFNVLISGLIQQKLKAPSDKREQLVQYWNQIIKQWETGFNELLQNFKICNLKFTYRLINNN